MAKTTNGIDRDRIERVGGLARSYVDKGKLAGVHSVVSRRGEVVYSDVYGMADIAGGRKLAEDSIYRIYSMTKPITSVALMMLYEQGACLLEDAVARYIPSFAGLQVFESGDADSFTTRAPDRAMTIRDLLTHTSGLSAGFIGDHPVEQIYRRDRVDGRRGDDLAAWVDRLAEVPLKFSPGTAWNYGCSTDVIGRLVEIMSGQRFDEFLAEHIFEPLGMVDTAFFVPEEKVDRLCAVYGRKGADLVEITPPIGQTSFTAPPAFLSGAGGLVSTAADYQRFLDMLLGKGAVDGVRLLGRKTLEYMTVNHLPGGQLMNEMGQSTFSEVSMDGTGFGLGFSVVVDPAAAQVVSSAGEYAWGGAASTVFWVDPAEELTVMLMTQFMPSAYYPIRRQLKVAVYQALTD